MRIGYDVGVGGTVLPDAHLSGCDPTHSEEGQPHFYRSDACQTQ